MDTRDDVLKLLNDLITDLSQQQAGFKSNPVSNTNSNNQEQLPSNLDGPASVSSINVQPVARKINYPKTEFPKRTSLINSNSANKQAEKMKNDINETLLKHASKISSKVNNESILNKDKSKKEENQQSPTDILISQFTLLKKANRKLTVNDRDVVIDALRTGKVSMAQLEEHFEAIIRPCSLLRNHYQIMKANNMVQLTAQWKQRNLILMTVKDENQIDLQKLEDISKKSSDNERQAILINHPLKNGSRKISLYGPTYKRAWEIIELNPHEFNHLKFDDNHLSTLRNHQVTDGMCHEILSKMAQHLMLQYRVEIDKIHTYIKSWHEIAIQNDWDKHTNDDDDPVNQVMHLLKNMTDLLEHDMTEFKIHHSHNIFDETHVVNQQTRKVNFIADLVPAPHSDKKF